MKIFHLADLHIRDQDIEECYRCLQAIKLEAAEERPELIIVAGDTFDSQNVKLESEAARLAVGWYSDIALIAPVVVITGTPSHDGRAVEILGYINNPRIWVASMPGQVVLAGGELLELADFMDTERQLSADLSVSLVPTPTKQFWNGQGGIAQTDQEISEAMNGIFARFGQDAGIFGRHILVGHFSVRGAQISDTQVMIGRDIEIGKDQLDLARADIVMLGHIHRAQKIEPNIFYSGSMYPLNFGELEGKGYWIHRIEGSETSSEFVKLPSRKLAKVKMDMTGESFDLEGGLDGTDFSGSTVRVEIRTYQDEAAKIDQGSIAAALVNRGAKDVDLRIIRVPRETVRSENLLKLQTLREKVSERARLANEAVAESVLVKADLLESKPPEEILAEAAS